MLFADASVTETDKTVVDGYLQLETPEKFYDRAKAFLVDNYAGETATIVSRSGNTINAGTYMSLSTQLPPLHLRSTEAKSRSRQASMSATSRHPARSLSPTERKSSESYGSNTVLPWSVTNVEATSTLQLFNVTQNAEVANLVTAARWNKSYGKRHIQQ